MDAESLYRQGVRAIRDEKDLTRGRELLVQSLRQDPQNDMAWLWLTRTVKNREKKLELINNALRINPNNEQALQFKQQLEGIVAPPAAALATQRPVGLQESRQVIRPLGASTLAESAPAPVAPVPIGPPRPTAAQAARIPALMERAEMYREAGDNEAAISQWVEVLKIQVDHEEAIRQAVGHLWRMQYWDDAKELIWRAIEQNTLVPFIWMTAVDIAERQGDHGAAEDLRNQLAGLPGADEKLLLTVADFYIDRYLLSQALKFLTDSLETHSENQALLVKTGDLYKQLGETQKAQECYDRAVRFSPRTKAGREADKRMSEFIPVLTDRERGSVWLAIREGLGFTLLFFALAWQDAGLDFLGIGTQRWLGVVLSFVGGYLVITATSSPQQQPLARWLGGKVPEPEPEDDKDDSSTKMRLGQSAQADTNLPMLTEDVRYFLGMVGIAVLMVAFFLVFNHAIDQVMTETPPYLPWSQ